jgi:hypothetical protein
MCHISWPMARAIPQFCLYFALLNLPWRTHWAVLCHWRFSSIYTYTLLYFPATCPCSGRWPVDRSHVHHTRLGLTYVLVFGRYARCTAAHILVDSSCAAAPSLRSKAIAVSSCIAPLSDLWLLTAWTAYPSILLPLRHCRRQRPHPLPLPGLRAR